MIESEWMELKVDDCVNCLDSQYAKNLRVAEIAEDERSLKNWRDRGYDIKRLIKFEGENGYHTWCGLCERWEKNYRIKKSNFDHMLLMKLKFATIENLIFWEINQKSDPVSFDCVGVFTNFPNYSARIDGLYKNDISLGTSLAYTAFYESLIARHLEDQQKQKSFEKIESFFKKIESIVDSLINKYKNFQN